MVLDENKLLKELTKAEHELIDCLIKNSDWYWFEKKDKYDKYKLDICPEYRGAIKTIKWIKEKVLPRC